VSDIAAAVETNAIAPPETMEVETEIVACDGDGGALGHPRVFLNMEGRGQVDCPYCDRRFVLKAGAGGGHH
jgi:NADH dehydrogenase (ubiquinone) Fe-S protein 6